VEQFRTEARTIARLTHPNIVRILEFGVEGNTPFLVMDYATGGTLVQRHPRGSIVPLLDVVEYIKQIASALQYAHDNKLIHRDVKPENMLIGRHKELFLSDFGIALIAQSSRYQGSQDLAGTIGYMAPEQIQARPRPASDQYALGIVVYEWLSGDRPFHGSFTEIAAKHATAPPPSLREKSKNISPDVEHVVMTALAKDPQQRFASVQAFAEALELASQDRIETILSVQPKLHPTSTSSLLTPINDIRSEQKEDTEEPHNTKELDSKDTTTTNNDRIVWTISFGKPRLSHLLAVLIGILLYSILTSLIDPGYFTLFTNFTLGYNYNVYEQPFEFFRFFEIIGALVLYGLAGAIPLFFGITFGPAVGFLTGGVGFWIGTLVSFQLYYVKRGIYTNSTASNYFDFVNRDGAWFLMLSVALLGLLAGLAASRMQGKYGTANNLLLAYSYSFMAVIISVSLIIFSLDSFVLHVGFVWSQLLLYVVALPGLNLLLVLLKAYDIIIQRIQAKRQRGVSEVL
jgi:serine/threonine protein kinase